MSRSPLAFAVLENTTTRQRIKLIANQGGAYLPQGSYKVLRCSRTPKNYHFSGLFSRLQVTEGGEEVMTFVLKTGVQHYAPFNPVRPHFVIVGSRFPDGEPPIWVEFHRNRRNEVILT